jgi:membrane protease YdiL (CAAX protease family)
LHEDKRNDESFDASTAQHPDLSTAAEVQTAPTHRPLHTLFLGRQGLRAGWGTLLFVLEFLLFITLASLVGKHFAHGRPAPNTTNMPARLMFFNELILAAIVLLITFINARMEGRRFGSFGLRDPAFLPRFAGGLVSGFVAISALVGLLWSQHLLTLHSAGLTGKQIAGYGLAWAAVFLLVGLTEEAMLRGYLLFTLSRGIGFFWAALLLSVAFGAIHGHNPGETPVGLFSAGAIGLVFCFSIWYTRSLAWAIGAHASWDWGESFFYGTSDSGLVVHGHLMNEQAVGAKLLSGGPTGPEGSLYVFVVVLLLALGIFLWWRRREPRPLALAFRPEQPYRLE